MFVFFTRYHHITIPTGPRIWRSCHILRQEKKCCWRDKITDKFCLMSLKITWQNFFHCHELISRRQNSETYFVTKNKFYPMSKESSKWQTVLSIVSSLFLWSFVYVTKWQDRKIRAPDVEIKQQVTKNVFSVIPFFAYYKQTKFLSHYPPM